MEEAKRVLEAWINYSRDVMFKDTEFVLKNCRDAVDSCFDLLNDVIDIGSCIMPNENERTDMFTKHLMYPMLVHVVYPNLNFLCIAILLGAIPQAFYSLRTALEALVVALYADSKDDLKDLAWYEKVEHESVRNATVWGVKDHLLKILTKVFGDRDGEERLGYILDLYQAISAWVHPVARIRFDKKEEIAAGILKAIMRMMAKRGVPPAYGIVIPMEYTSEELDDLKHLNEIVKHARLAVALIAYTWSIDKDVTDRGALKERLEELSKIIQSS